MSYKLIEGDCTEELAKLPEASIDAIVCDPPYGLGFMGYGFDKLGEGAQQAEWHRRWAEQAIRVLKPGGHILAFGGTRTYHHLATGLEQAGFEIRDQLQWLYGSGFPKSLDVSKAIDKQRDDKEDIYKVTAWIRAARDKAGITNPTIDKAFGMNTMARHWTDIPPKGKQPAIPTLDQIPQLLELLGVELEEVPEDIARLIFELNGKKGQPGANWFKREIIEKKKMRDVSAGNIPLPGASNGKFVDIAITAPATSKATQWQGYGTNLKPANEPIVLARKPLSGTVAATVLEHGTGALNIDGCRIGLGKGETPDDLGGGTYGGVFGTGAEAPNSGHEQGRWPSNVLLDEEAAALLDEQAESTSRFFYCAKPSKKEREAGLDHLASKKQDESRKEGNPGGDNPRNRGLKQRKNHHPTVKPVELMRYLCRLVAPEGATILDPFTGSGSTGCAVVLENKENDTDWHFIGIEMEPEYIKIAKARIDHLQA